MSESLGSPLELPCGLILKNRLVKAAMSDSLGDGAGAVTPQQIRLYQRWTEGQVALSIIGEVQVDHRFPEKPGNLVLDHLADEAGLAKLAKAGETDGSHIWPQLGHAGALAHGPISNPAGPTALDVEGLSCRALSTDEIQQLPNAYASAASKALRAGFSGVQIHAGHGFLLSQFLSPLFNRRQDRYGGSCEARSQVLIEIVNAVRQEVGSEFAIGVKINSTDQLEGGLTEEDSLGVIELLDATSVDLVDISGGTYFPGAAASTDRRSSGPYFVDFVRRARAVTNTPLMTTGGFKTRQQASDAVAGGATDLVGLARALVIDPDLAATWLTSEGDPEFPSFDTTPPGGVTAWYTMRLTALANDKEANFNPTLAEALADYEERDGARDSTWAKRFGAKTEA